MAKTRCPFELKPHTILLTVGGSRAYGIHRESSDVDVKGVCIPPPNVLLSCFSSFEQAEGSDDIADFYDLFDDEEKAAIKREKLEGVVYDLQKFMRMATECNPNILDALFCRDEEVRLCTPAGKRLRESRDLFLSTKAKHTFSGYAAAQLKRIRGHRRWLIDPPKARPERKDYDLFEAADVKQMKAALDAVGKKMDGWELDLSRLEKAERIPLLENVQQTLAEMNVPKDAAWKSAARTLGYDENFLLVLEKERRYARDLEDFKKFRNWEKNRNPARAALEKKHGYDTKHAAHLVRLLRMAREILEEGRVNVWRGDRDRDELLAIRDGAWSYDDLLAWAEAEDAAQNRLLKSKSSVLPKSPDKGAIESLSVELLQHALRSS